MHIPPSKCLKLNLIHQLEKDTRWLCLKMWFSNKSPGTHVFSRLECHFRAQDPDLEPQKLTMPGAEILPE